MLWSMLCAALRVVLMSTTFADMVEGSMLVFTVILLLAVRGKKMSFAVESTTENERF